MVVDVLEKYWYYTMPPTKNFDRFKVAHLCKEIVLLAHRHRSAFSEYRIEWWMLIKLLTKY